VKDDRPYLADIVQALERVEEIGRRGREAFLADWLLQDAAIRNFEIVGEAAKRVSPALQARTRRSRGPIWRASGTSSSTSTSAWTSRSCGRSSNSAWRRCAARWPG
jgi:hypothetical protein